VENYDKRATQSKELRERRAERAEIGRKTRRTRSRDRDHDRDTDNVRPSAPSGGKSRSGENLSFASLIEDEEPAAYRISAPREESQAVSYGGGGLVDPDALNKRVLTGSARGKKPIWLSGSVLAILSWVLLVSAYRATEMGAQKAILTLVALLLSLGAVAWLTPSALSKEVGPSRTRSRLVLLVGLAALVGAILIYVRRWLEFQ